VHNLSPVRLELGSGGFLQGHRDGGRGVIVRPTLQGWKHRAIDGIGVFGLAQNHGATRPTQALVSGGHHHIGIGDGALMYPGDDEAGDMSDIGHEAGPNFPGDVAESLEVKLARVGRGPREDEFRLLFPR
jgi:hypothetical protein